MRRWPIRIRVAMMAGLAGLAASVAVGAVALWRTSESAQRDLDEFLSRETTEVISLVSTGGRFENLVDLNPSSGQVQRIALYDADGTVLDRTAELPPVAPDSGEGSRIETAIDPQTGDEFRAFIVPFNTAGDLQTIVLATPTRFVSDRVTQTALEMIPLVLLAVAAIGGGAYVLTGLVLRPVERLRTSAIELSAAPEGGRLAVPEANDELRSLALTLNAALDTIDVVTTRHREFVAEASHELRAPLARLSADLEYASRPTRTPEEVAQGFDALGRHTSDMVRVADELIDLLEERDTLNTEPVALAVLLAEIRLHVRHRSSLWTVENCEPGIRILICDPGQVAGAVRNLVDNAFEHGSEPVTLTIDCSDAAVSFTVEDAGPGIPEDMLDTVRRPFVRGKRHGGRAGLGLAIVSRVATRHGGDLQIEISPRSCFTLTLPLTANV